MIKAEAIAAQLQAALPQQTNLFSRADIAITSLTRTGTTITAVTATPHGLQTNNNISILNAKTPIVISSITSIANPDGGATVTVTTETNHDFTENFGFTCEITGATQAAYNGTFDVAKVPNRRTFTYIINSQPDSPATGTMFLLNNFLSGYNGRKQVTVVNPTTFTYETTQEPLSPAQGTAILRSGVRVARAISWDRAMEAYTRQNANELWAFVVLGDLSISKSRRDGTDAIQTLASGDEYRSRLILPFSIYIYAPCTNEIAGGAVRDQMEDVRVALYKSILRTKFDPILKQAATYVTIATGDRFVQYNTAYYIHEFMFEIVCDITIGDTIAPSENVAFRDFSLIYIDPLVDDGDNIIMQTDDVSLDDVPL
jgi:hypothetical protein